MDNKLDYYLSKIERQLDFHRGLHLFEMEMNPNFTNKAVFLKESQEEYITNLFGNNKNIRESYNREFNNVIVESTFNPKDEVKKFFSFLKENYINEIKKTNLINEQSSKTFINEQMEVFPWKRNNDFFGYWVLLYNTLKAAGIGVKCEVANNPGKSKFMYWGGWAINVDLLKNGGYPISFTDPATKVSMTFKFKGGKYAGQAANNIILEPKSIPPTFNLGVFGKISNKQMSDTILKYQKATPVATPQDLKIGQQVFNELKYAFDGAGTYENEAVAAFNKIKNKFQLDELNRLVKARGRFPNVYGWLQDEMSDYDYKQYRAIWDRLKSIDKTIVAPKVNNALRVVSAVGDVTGVNAVVSAGEKVGTAIKAGFTWLKDKGLPWFMEKLRDALGSTAGAVLQSLLDMTGIGAIGVSVLWAALTLFDVWQISSGAGGWAKLFFSVIGLLSAGALAKTVGTFLKPLFGTGGTIGSFFSGIANKPWFIKYIKPVVGWIGGKLSGAASLLTQAGEWVVKKLGATAIGGMVTKAVQWLKSIAENIVKFAGAGAKAETQSLAKAEVKTQGEKIFTKAVVDPLKDKAKEKVIQGSEYVGGTKGKAAAELAFGVQDLRKSSGDLGSAITKGDYVKTAEKAVKTYDKFGNVVDKGTQLVTNEPKKVTGPVG
jgi:predicted 3-demethylubiquinone-9 3-methyltransferase (glyoxalase superfamily)